MSEKQQQIKIDFEEKERQEARRKVQEDKRRKKLVSINFSMLYFEKAVQNQAMLILRLPTPVDLKS